MSDDGFYGKKQLREVVQISKTQVDRLESKGEFPKRVVLSGTSRNSKVGWVKKEVLGRLILRTAGRCKVRSKQGNRIYAETLE